jgi:O-antigen/teichoic acid export membrane protein
VELVTVRIIHWTFRFLRGSSAASAIAHVVLTNGLILGLNVVTGIVTARFLGPEGRGELAAIILWPQFLGYAFAFALPSAVVYEARRDPASRRAVIRAALGLSLAGGCLALGVGLAAMPQLLHHASADTLRYARWMMIFALPATVATVLTAVLQLDEKFHAYNRARYLPLLLTLAALAWLAGSAALTPLSGAWSYFLPGVPVFAWMAWRVRACLEPGPRRSRGVIGRLLSYSTRAYGGEAAGTLLGQLDKIMLVNLLVPAHFGIYVVVFNLSRVLTMLPAAIVPVLLPKTAGRSAAEVVAITGQTLSIATPTLLLGGAILVATGSGLLQLLYGAEFAAGYLPLCLLLTEAVIASLAQVIIQPFLALNRPGVITIIQAGSLAALGAALWLLVPPFGITGAALGLLVATLLRAVSIYAAYRVTLNVRAPRMWPSLHDTPALLRRLREAR